MNYIGARMGKLPLILVSPSIQKHGVEFHDLSASLSVRYNEAVLQAGGIPVTVPTTIDRAILAEAIRRVHNGEVYLPPQIAQKLVDRMQKPQLSSRELEVLKAVAAGKSNKEIGVQLFISEGTVKTHVESLLSKLSAATRTSAVKAAVRRGLVQMT